MNTNRIRISSGIGELDLLLGGLLIGDNVVFYDDAGSLASVFCLNFLQASQLQEKPFIYVSFDRSPRNLLEKLGVLAENPALTILDCFTAGKGKNADIFRQFYRGQKNRWPCRIIQVENPEHPDTVMEHFLNVHASMKEDVRFVFESLTGMQELWAGEDQISRFYSHTCPRLYELNTIGYWIMEKNAHSKRLKASINQIAQVAIELSLKRGKSSISVLKAENRDITALNTPHHYWTHGLNVSLSKEKQSSGRVDLGQRIREIRTRRGLSQTELAKLIGVTPSNISQVESNQIFPSLPALLKMAEILSIEMGSFFSNSNEIQNKIIFSESESAEVHFPDLPKDSISARLLTPLGLEPKIEPYLIEIHPRKSLPSHFFIHKGEEIGYVLSGKIQVKLGNSTHNARAGDIIYLTAEIPTQWKNPGANSARILWFKIK